MSGLKIAVAGTGYVGLSNAMLLAQHNEVVALDIVPEKVAMLNAGQSPIDDVEIRDFLANKTLNFVATTDKERAYRGAHFIIIATPIIVLYIIYAGFLYVTARGNAQQVEQATRALTYAIIGGVIVLGAVAMSQILANVVASFKAP